MQLFAAAGRFVLWLVIEVVFQVAISGTGHAVLRYVFRVKRPDDFHCLLVGVFVFVCAASVAFLLYEPN